MEGSDCIFVSITCNKDTTETEIHLLSITSVTHLRQLRGRTNLSIEHSFLNALQTLFSNVFFVHFG